jgi:ribosomal protein S18 acetylase RimI-like enzyme
MESMHLETLKPSDWRVLRDARLEALLDSPHAFTSSFAHESRWGEPEWRRMFLASLWMVAREDDLVIGVARSIGEAAHPAVRHLESIWVAPTHRKRGVCRALLHQIAERELQSGVTDLLLWVLEENHDAQSVYLALGFQPTQERQFLHVVGQHEQRLRRPIKRLSDRVPIGQPVGVDNGGPEVGTHPSLQLQ